MGRSLSYFSQKNIIFYHEMMTAVFATWVSMISKLWYHQYHTDQILKKFVASETFLQLPIFNLHRRYTVKTILEIFDGKLNPIFT